ncbi:hypothetical protein [Nonomuraea insulae]|uniref:MFS transporter n=1 Tax=Nonomuraea insulae TaxID=1616787 RepID=A0ABW1CJ05_9ACTN
MWIRKTVSESPLFEQTRDSEKPRRPLRQVFRDHRRPLIITIGMRIASDVSYYTFALFSITYVTQQLGFDKSLVLNGVMAASVVQLCVTAAPPSATSSPASSVAASRRSSVSRCCPRSAPGRRSPCTARSPPPSPWRPCGGRRRPPATSSPRGGTLRCRLRWSRRSPSLARDLRQHRLRHGPVTRT